MGNDWDNGGKPLSPKVSLVIIIICAGILIYHCFWGGK